MRKWIVFRVHKQQPGWEDRKYAHTGSLTKTLAEHYDCSDSQIPEVGYRPPEFIKLEQFVDPGYPEAKTHYRSSDWEVVSVETYSPDATDTGFDMVVICHCKYSPIGSAFELMPERSDRSKF